MNTGSYERHTHIFHPEITLGVVSRTWHIRTVSGRATSAYQDWKRTRAQKERSLTTFLQTLLHWQSFPIPWLLSCANWCFHDSLAWPDPARNGVWPHGTTSMIGLWPSSEQPGQVTNTKTNIKP